MQRWWIGGVIAGEWRMLRARLAAIPAPAWWTWSGSIALGVCVTAALTTGLVLGARAVAPRGLDMWDAAALRRIEHGPLSYVNAITLESPGNLLVLGPLVLVGALLLGRAGSIFPAASLLAAYVLARGFVFLGWGLWDRARPASVAEGLASPGLQSFPSGHALLSLSAYGFLFWLWGRRTHARGERVLVATLCAAWLLAIGWARLRLGTHWPSDVLAGWLLGGIWLAFVARACTRGEARAAAVANPTKNGRVRQEGGV